MAFDFADQEGQAFSSQWCVLSTVTLDLIRTPEAICLRLPGREGSIVSAHGEDGLALVAWLESQVSELIPTISTATIRRVQLDRLYLCDLPIRVARQLDQLI